MSRRKVIAVVLVLAMVFQFCLFSSQGVWAEGPVADPAATEATSPGDEAENIESDAGVEGTAPVVDMPEEQGDALPADPDAASEAVDDGNTSGEDGEAPSDTSVPDGSDAVNGEPAETEQPAEEPPKTDEEIHMNGATYVKNGETEAVDLFGDAADRKSNAKEALQKDTPLDDDQINDAVGEIFDEKPIAAPAADTDGDGDESNDPPRQADGSSIESISAKWIIADSAPDNGDEALLYVKPGGLESQSVRLQINYALSGEHNYDPGDITITVPAYIFKDRNGKNIGNLIIPYPEDPSKRSDFNWKLVGDHYVITNTKRMSAATKGYMQFQYEGLRPEQLVDMEVSAPFSAYIEVVTHKGNTIALRSNELTAQFDTEARLNNVSKYYRRVTRVKASQIPAEQRIEGEDEYIKVDWYVRGTTSSNTYYTITQTDSIPQASVVESRSVVATEEDVKDPNKQITLEQAHQMETARVLRSGIVVDIDPAEIQTGDTVVYKTEADIKGFVIGGSNADAASVTKEDMFTGYTSGMGRDYEFSTAYPASQFEPDVEYTFHNSINYTVKEVDPAAEVINPNVGEDPQLITGQNQIATAQTTWHYSDPKWINPGGHYMVHKNGNDDTDGRNITHSGIYTYTDLHRQGSGYYGIYPSAINELQDEYKAHGENGSVRLSYTIETVGYTLPWMYHEVYPGTPKKEEDRKSEDDIWEIAPTRIAGNYNRPIQMTTSDTGISIGRGADKLTVLEDYTYEEVEFPNVPWVFSGKPQNINPDGSWTALTVEDGTFKYSSDTDRTHWPDITLQIQRGGEWEDWAVASWQSGSRVVTMADGTVIPDHGGTVKLPAGTENIRTTVVTQNSAWEDTEAAEALQAGIDYDIRVVVNLKSTKEMIDLIEKAFEKSNTPSMFVYNGANVLIEYPDVAVNDETRIIHSIDREGYDSIRGYTTDTAVYPYKSSTQRLSEVDYEARTVLIHYSAEVQERSYISDRKSWEQAVADGRLVTESHGTWRDLLPKGVTPDLSTIKLRKGDTLKDAYTVEDYQGSGRTLLVVEADLTPAPVQYRSGDSYYYEDVPSIQFDAVYDFESLIDYGYNLHNVIAFESSNPQIGTVEHYKGEPDDPTATNNVSTPKAFDTTPDIKGKTEQDYMKDLDDQRDDPSFVYAGAWTKIDILSAARTSLYKDVQVNNDGIWSEGTYYKQYYDDPPKEATEGGRMRTVYEGGQYTYRLRIMSDPETISTDLIMYDSLENFYAVGEDENADNDYIDTGAPRWHGTFRGVDTTQLEEMGCDPVVYYSTEPNLQLADETDPDKAVTTNVTLPTDDEESDIWTRSDLFKGDLADVKAIAVDCSRANENADESHRSSDGRFHLQPMESITVLVRMQAPAGDEAAALIAQKGRWGDSAMAYNNAYLLCTNMDKDQDINHPVSYDTGNFVRKDYTKVGLKEYSLSAKKVWNDDNDRDGKRPDTVTFRLYADGEPAEDLEGNPIPPQVLDAASGETSVHFEHIPYTTPDGTKIHYTIEEEPIEDENGEALYTAGYAIDDTTYTFTNTHEPERTSITGTKTWEGDTASTRPASFNVELYANGKLLKTQTVRPASNGTWTYAFTNLYKYENGEEIEYTVKETKTPNTGDALDSYVQEQEETDAGFDMTNTYHPYGDLSVKKTVTNATAVSAEQEFTFTFTFSRMQAGEGGTPEAVPVFDAFDYEVLNEDGEAVSDEDGEPITGTIENNGSIRIRGGQTIHIKEMPQGTVYQVTEDEEEGFTLTDSTGAAGTIRPNANTEAAFTNDYYAKGQVNLTALKTLQNRKLQNYQFRFELYEVNEEEDEDGTVTEEETLRATASSATPTKVTERTDGTVESSAAPVTFGALRYTQADHGKTFRYRIYEVDTEKPGYTYSKAVYEAEVSVQDNGNGTLTITPVYKTYKDETGEPVSEQATVDSAVFDNTYTASGETALRAWKSLPGGALEGGDFTFELLDENGEPVADEDGNPVTAQNAKDGTVVFDPAAIASLQYDQTDIGKTYYYGIRETEGDKETIIYDDTVFGYKVTIIDNGDGILYAEQKLVTPVYDEEDPETITGWTEEGAKLPVFENELKDGSFSVQKTVVDSPDADPDQVFHFKVKLIGDKVTDDTITEYTLSQAGEDDEEEPDAADSGESDETPADDAADDSGNAMADAAESVTTDALINGEAGVSTPKERMDRGLLTAANGDDENIASPSADETILYQGKCDAMTDTSIWNFNAIISAEPSSLGKSYWTNVRDDVAANSGKYSGVDWRITADGELIIGKEGETQYFYPWRARAYDAYPNTTQNSYRVPISYSTGNDRRCYTWHPYRSQIKSVRFEGTVIGQGDMNGLFRDCTNLKRVDLAGFDTSQARGLGYMFANCGNLTEILHFEDLDTSRMIWLNDVFSGCTKLTEIDASNIYTATTYSIERVFQNCSGIEFLDLSNFDMTSTPRLDLDNGNHAVSAQALFSGCSKLNTVILGPEFRFGSSTLPPNGQKWVRQEGDPGTKGSYTASELASSYNSAWAGTWVWSGKTFYTVHFLADDAAGGTAPIRMMVAEDGEIPANTFSRFGYDFDHWVVTDADGEPILVDGAEKTYADKDPIRANTYAMNEQVYLKAVFAPRDTSVDMKDGEFEITLKAGEKATFDKIPAGTAYQVYEETPKGWVLVEQSGVSGTIEPLQTQKAAFVNKYEPGTATAQFFGTKTLDGRAAAGGAFKFVLKEGDEVIQTDVPTLDGGFIQFDPIVYREAGTHTYTIEEMDPQDEALDWDTHSETVTVEVTADEDGNLTAVVSTDDDGIVFANKTRPGNLRISKTAEGLTDANKDDEFTFKITLNNANGMPLGSDEAVYWYIENEQQSDNENGNTDDQNGKESDDQPIEPNAGPSSDAQMQTAPILHSTHLQQTALSSPMAATGSTVVRNGAADASLAKGASEDDILSKEEFNYTGAVQQYQVTADGFYKLEVWGAQGGSYNKHTMRNKMHDAAGSPWTYAGTRGGYSTMTVWLEEGQMLYIAAGGAGAEVSGYVDRADDPKLAGGWNGGGRGGFAINQHHSSTSGGGASHIALSYGELSSLSNKQDRVLLVAGGGGGISWLTNASGFRGVGGGESGGTATNIATLGVPSGKWTAKGGTQTTGYAFGRGQDGSNGTNGSGSGEGSGGGGGGWYGGYSHSYKSTSNAQSIGGGGGSGHINAAYKGYFDGQTIAGDKSFFAPDGAKETGHAGNGHARITQLSSDAYGIQFDGNGGYPAMHRKLVQSADEEVTLPTVTNPAGNLFHEWNTQPDGKGESYNGTITGEQLGIQPGETITLYAIWLGKDERHYDVEHYRQNVDNDEYSLYETESRLIAKVNDTVSPEEHNYEGFSIKDHESSYTIPESGQLTVKYYYDRNRYQIRFDGNGADSGQMNTPQTLKYDQQAALLKNTYQKKGSLFTGWNTEAGGGGATYFDRQKVKNLTAEDGGTVTLYAQWMSNEDNRLEPTNGEIIVKCKAGESIVIPDLPAGTTYTIEEINLPSGWSQSGEIEGGSGTIEANVTKDAAVNNAYTAQGQAQINAHKILNGGDIDDCTFTFELLDADGSVVDTKTQGLVDTYEQIDSEDGESLVDNPYYQTALVQFDPFAEQLQFTQDDIGKDYTYTIREVKNSGEDGIEYDAHEYHATVHIEDAGHGQLSAAVTYDFDTDSGALEPIFINNMKPAALSVTKSVENASDDVKDTAFTFTVDLFDAEGNPLEGDFTVTKRTAAGEESQAGTVKAGGTIELCGGETAVIEGIPHDAAYKVTEQAVKNWEQTAAENPEGGFTAGETTAVSFTNTYTEPEPEEYDAAGSVQLTAKKTMEGGTIRLEDGFQFELTDAQGEVIDTKGPDRVSREADPDNGVAAEDVTESTITFDPIEYDLSMLDYPDDVEDQISAAFQTVFEAYQKEYNEAKAAYEEAYGQEHPDEAIPKYKDFAKYLRDEHGTTLRLIMEQVEKEIKDSPDNRRQATFTYYVREVEGADQTIEYDTARYYYVVHVKDEGDGTLSTDVTCFKPGTTQKTDEEGNPVVDEYGEPVYEDTPLEEIAFVNKKSAELKVRKVDSRTGETLEGVRFTVEKTDAESGDDAADGRLYLQSDGTLTETPYEFVTGKTGTFSVSDVPAGRYTLTETEALPGYIAAAPVTFEVKEGQVLEDGDPVSVITVHNSKDYGQLVIEKTLSKFKSSEPVTCVFSVVADLNGEIVYDQYVSMTFSDAGTQKVVIKDIPKEAVVTVTEVYAGAGYTAEGEQVIVLRDEDNKASFTNSYDDQSLSGYGATNIYERSEGGWSWKQLAEGAVIEAGGNPGDEPGNNPGGDSPGDTDKN